MPFAIITTDKPGFAAVRAAYQSAHKRYLDAHCSSLLLAAGAQLDDDARRAHGGILLLDTEDRAVAEAFLRDDPFTVAGLFESVIVTRWRKAFYNHERYVPLD